MYDTYRSFQFFLQRPTIACSSVKIRTKNPLVFLVAQVGPSYYAFMRPPLVTSTSQLDSREYKIEPGVGVVSE